MLARFEAVNARYPQHLQLKLAHRIAGLRPVLAEDVSGVHDVAETTALLRVGLATRLEREEQSITGPSLHTCAKTERRTHHDLTPVVTCIKILNLLASMCTHGLRHLYGEKLQKVEETDRAGVRWQKEKDAARDARSAPTPRRTTAARAIQNRKTNLTSVLRHRTLVARGGKLLREGCGRNLTEYPSRCAQQEFA